MKTIILLITWAEPDERGKSPFRPHCVPPIPQELLASGKLWVISGYAENERFPWSIVPADKAWESFVTHAWQGTQIYGVGVPARDLEEAQAIQDELRKDDMAYEEQVEHLRRECWKDLGYESLKTEDTVVHTVLA